MVKYLIQSVPLRLFLPLCIIFPVADGSVHAFAHPNEIEVGLTTTLTVNCTFSVLEHCEIKNPVSLMLSFASNTSMIFKHLASVNPYSGTQVIQASPNGNPDASGNLSSDGDSFLELTWKDPIMNQAGVYKCTMTGLNDFGVAVVKGTTVEVSAQAPDIDFLIARIIKLQGQFQDAQKDILALSITDDNLKAETATNKEEISTHQKEIAINKDGIATVKNETATNKEEISTNQKEIAINKDGIATVKIETATNNDEISTLTGEMEGLKRELKVLNEMYSDGSLEQVINSTLTRLNEVETRQVESKKRVHKAAEAMFDISSLYKGNQYYLSKEGHKTPMHEAEKMCRFFGGYLAEINDKSELHFVHNFIKEFSEFEQVFVGGSDQTWEGHVVYQHIQVPKLLRPWGEEEPQEDCFTLNRPIWLFHDFDCKTPLRYLCEVPTNGIFKWEEYIVRSFMKPK